MEKLQITKGEYMYQKDSSLEYPRVLLGDAPVMIIDAEFQDDNGNCDDIVLLASDALNTYQQCETLPSELLRQNQEMREVLELIKSKAVSNRVLEIISNCLTSLDKGKE